jgi:predicted TIM-barrel fold metal-dependent hydrolase
VEQMIEYDKPILIHTFVKAVDQLEFESTSRNVANLAQRYPEAKIIMAHLGGEPCHGIRPVAKYKNVWIDHSGTLVGSNDLQHAIDLVGVDRILFGSDLPVGFACSYGQVLEAKLTEEEREKILWKNTAKLFGESV